MAHHGSHRHVACAVLTASDTRTPETDTSGQRIQSLLREAGHQVAAYAILPDDPRQIGVQLDTWLTEPSIHAVLINGGTGLAPRDTTFEAISARLDKHLDGFGELFRRLSFDEIGAAAMLSRAIAGTAQGRFVASMPGSTPAVELAMTRLIIPQLGHIVALLTS